MPSCIVPCCTNFSTGDDSKKSKFYKSMEKHGKISFHKLPRNENKRNIWLKSLQISKSIPKSGVVCSLHFNDKDFNRTLTRIVLREDAVPTYYPLDGENKKNAEDIQFEDSIHDQSFSSSSSTDVQPSKQLKDVSNHNISTGTSQRDNDISAEKMILDEETGNFVVTKTSITKDENDVSLNIPCDENLKVNKSITTQSTSMSPEYNQGDKETNCHLLTLLKEKERQLQVQQKILKNLKRKLVRKERTIVDLKNVIKTADNKVSPAVAPKKRLLDNYQLHNFEHIDEQSNENILKIIINEWDSKPGGKQYPPELKSFALNLYNYSPKAYEYVRKKFNSCLPTPKTIYRWYKSIDSNPSLNMEDLHC